jgi:hypothetical protein
MVNWTVLVALDELAIVGIETVEEITESKIKNVTVEHATRCLDGGQEKWPRK